MTDLTTLSKRLNQTKLIRENLNLLTASEIFDTLYYLSYHPKLSKALINPSLEYLMLGGYNGSDPGPNFDSSHYLENYSDVKYSGMNPLIHFIKFGIHEKRSPYSLDGGKFIEFLGINGAGKTTLYHKANNFLHQKLGYKPGSSLLWTNIIKDVRYTALQNRLKNQSVDCMYSMNELHQRVHLAAKEYQFRTSYFDILCKYIITIKLDRAKPWIMFDEGLYNILARLIINDEGELSRYGEDILESMPKADLLIHVKADVTHCYKNYKLRKLRGSRLFLRTRLIGDFLREYGDKIPILKQRFDEKALILKLIDKDRILDQLSKLLRNRGVNIVTIDNNLPLYVSHSQIRLAISRLLG